MTTMKRSREDNGQVEAEAMANCALMLSSRLNNNNDFECKTCNKRFPSFQALGGHRTSHNKKPQLLGETNQKSKVHKCSICGMEFALGQALGGHMRRHRDEINKVTSHEKTIIPILHKSNSSKRISIFGVNLNITPNVDDLKLWPMEEAPSPVLRIFF
ncbi:zinc finger protein ZAT11-like [Solanum pennellii]|uniref:Zinc finger protein ZAT11-like n=1 Tax=Solanum pennellii TaxID=28526 RepID=A0ABM1FJX7_SOLPN|nr:zinc finger protein ZAT11-like [Solanum pennellii]